MSKSQKVILGGAVAILVGSFMAHFGLVLPGWTLFFLGVFAIVIGPIGAEL